MIERPTDPTQAYSKSYDASNHTSQPMVTNTLSNHIPQSVSTSSPKWSFRVNQPTQLPLVNLESLQKMIECTLITAYLENEKPSSLIICAKPESGRTSTMKQYRENKGIA